LSPVLEKEPPRSVLADLMLQSQTQALLPPQPPPQPPQPPPPKLPQHQPQLQTQSQEANIPGVSYEESLLADAVEPLTPDQPGSPEETNEVITTNHELKASDVRDKLENFASSEYDFEDSEEKDSSISTKGSEYSQSRSQKNLSFPARLPFPAQTNSNIVKEDKPTEALSPIKPFSIQSKPSGMKFKENPDLEFQSTHSKRLPSPSISTTHNSSSSSSLSPTSTGSSLPPKLTSTTTSNASSSTPTTLSGQLTSGQLERALQQGQYYSQYYGQYVPTTTNTAATVQQQILHQQILQQQMFQQQALQRQQNPYSSQYSPSGSQAQNNPPLKKE